MNLKNVRALVLPFLMVCGSILTGGQNAQAGSGLTTFLWWQSGVTVSSSSYKYSNMSGFVQAIVNSNGCPLTVDGVYGNLTTWYTADFQNDVIGWNNGGVMNPSMWYELDNDTTVYGPSKTYQGFADGYGTQYWGFYGGIDPGAELGWNPYSAQWMFSPYPVSNRAYLISATPTLTIGSTAPCS